METVLLVIHLILALLLIVAVLMQRSEGGGLGIGGGGGGANVGGFMSVRGTANFLTRATAILAALFMLTSLSLAILAGNARTTRSILDAPAASETQQRQPESKEGEVPLSR